MNPGAGCNLHRALSPKRSALRWWEEHSVVVKATFSGSLLCQMGILVPKITRDNVPDTGNLELEVVRS